MRNRVHDDRVCVGMVVLVLMVSANGQLRDAKKMESDVDVGIIVDLDSTVGKMSRSCISMALSDFYATHNYTTKIVPHFRNSNSDNVQATSAAIDLLKNVQVQAIVGPQRSSQANFVIEIGNKSRVPIISPATSPSLSPKDNPYFIRTAQNSSSQAAAIAALVKAFGWREIVVIYENSNFGRGVIPFLTDTMLEISAQVKYRTVLSPFASDDRILQELYKLKTMQTRVFVVYLLPNLASRLFIKANEAGMMSKGYAWIITDVLTSLLHSLNPTDIDSMQGVIGVKSYIPQTKELMKFKKRWKRNFLQENPDMHRIELDMFGTWAYDTIFALAMALERVSTNSTIRQYRKPAGTRESLSTDLGAIGTSEMGPNLLPLIRNIRFKGLSGDFNIVDGELQSSAYQIVNVIGKGARGIGFWNSKNGISKKPMLLSSEYSTNKDHLGAIIWPGETHVIPKGWELPTNGEKLRVGIPVKGGFDEFIKVQRDPRTNQVNPIGFCVDVFKAVMEALPYAVPYEFIPFESPDSKSARNYTELVYQIVLEQFDAVVGDVTILSKRSNFVDFTLPYTESGVSMIVLIKDDERKNAWIFTRPLNMDLWITTGAFFIYTGVVVWALEHRVNKEFRGHPHKQVGMIFWFSFSTLVFSHKEKMMSNLSRFVVIVWIFVVLVLTSSYTASLTSMLTIQKLKPEFTDIYDLMRKGEYIGYQTGSFVTGMLEEMKFDGTKFKNYSTLQEYDEALSKGSKNGGVSAIVDETPYIRLFLSKYCTKYTMVGPMYKTAGFGFAFPKGSPLVPDVSTAVLHVTERNLNNISNRWFKKEPDCPEQDGAGVTSDGLTLDSFKGIFLIAGVSSTSALIISLIVFLYENREILVSDGSMWEKLSAIARTFNEEKDKKSSDKSNKTNEGTGPAMEGDDVLGEDNIRDCPLSPAISEYQQAEGRFSYKGFSTPEPGTPIHDDTIDITETRVER